MFLTIRLNEEFQFLVLDDESSIRKMFNIDVGDLKYLQQKWDIGDESDCLVHQYHCPRKVAKNYEKFSSYDKAALKYFILRGKFHDIFSIDIDFKMSWITDFYIISRLWAKNSWFLKQKRHFRKRIQCILRKCISILWKTIRNPSEVYWSVWNQVLENIFCRDLQSSCCFVIGYGLHR